LSGKLKIKVLPGTLAFRVYQKEEVFEPFNCNYELNPEYRETLEKAGLNVSGIGETGGARIVELPGHRFFLATGFQPQLLSTPERPHPLFLAFLEAAGVSSIFLSPPWERN